jgi:hypothetical protein
MGEDAAIGAAKRAAAGGGESTLAAGMDTAGATEPPGQPDGQETRSLSPRAWQTKDGTPRAGSPQVIRGEFVLTESEHEILYPTGERVDQRVFADSSWAQPSSASLRSVDGPGVGYRSAGFNPNQLGHTLRARTGQRPGRGGDPLRPSEGSSTGWPRQRPNVQFQGDRVRAQVMLGHKTISAARETNRNLAGWKLSTGQSRPISPRVYKRGGGGGNAAATLPPAHDATPQERLHSAPAVANGSASLVYGAVTTKYRSSPRPFTPRQLSLGGWGRPESITAVKGTPPRHGLGVFFAPPRRPSAGI